MSAQSRLPVSPNNSVKMWSWFGLGLVLGMVITAGIGWWFLTTQPALANQGLLTPFIEEYESQTKPLQKYAIPTLATQTFQPASIELLELLETTEEYSSYVFRFTSPSSDHTITGQINLPAGLTRFSDPGVIIMARGYVPLDIYETGEGTRNSAAVYASNGFVTIAPDFLGYGGSDPELENTWENRFVKPIQIIELIEGVRQTGFPLGLDPTPDGDIPVLTSQNIGLWGHSNGGQIMLTALEILGQPLPTTLWAPVTAPFPYSIAFFSDELPDEGRQQRAWIALFERDYNAQDFSLTQHLDLLAGELPLQIHHGSADEAALKTWSDEFVQKLEAENQRRANSDTKPAPTASPTDSPKPTPDNWDQPLAFEYYEYPGADHNLRPDWNTVVQRDVAFFQAQLSR